MLLTSRQFRFLATLATAGCFYARNSHGASLEWHAPPFCPTAEVVREQLARELGGELATLPDLAFDAQLRQLGSGLELKLVVRKDGTIGERRIRAGSCDEAVDALAAAMTLVLQPLVTKNAADKSNTDPESSNQSPHESHQAQSPSNRGNVQAPSTPPPMRSARQREPALRSTSSGFANLEALLDSGTLPMPAFGALATVGLSVHGLQIGARGLLIPAQQATVSGSAQVEFELVAAGVGLCSAPTGKTWGMHACLGGEAGQLRGAGAKNVINARSGRSLWIAATAEAWALVRPGSQDWGAFLNVVALVPLHRETFVFSSIPGSIHRPASIGLRVGLGLEFEFQ